MSRRPSVPRRHNATLIGVGFLLTLAAAAGTAIARTPAGGISQGPVIAAAPAPALPAPPGTTERVSIGGNGTQGNGAGGGVSGILASANGDQAISADGRWVAFVSAATNLIPGSAHPAGGVYVRDRQSGTTLAVPWLGGGAFPAGVSAAEPVISGDGGVVAFTAIVNPKSSNALPVPTTTPYVLAWDRQTNSTTLVSVDSQSQPTPGFQPSISADGRYVAYTQWAQDKTPPILSNLTANPTSLQYLPCGPESSTISVTATDPDDGVSSVTLFYAPNGGSTSSQAMSPQGSNVWQGTITLAQGWSTGQITYWVQATDSHGNTSASLFPSSSNILTLNDCIV